MIILTTIGSWVRMFKAENISMRCFGGLVVTKEVCEKATNVE